MTIDDTAARLSAVANIVHVAIGPEHLHVVATAPAPWDKIAEITEGVRAVDVTVATPVAQADAARFRENRHLRELYDREGKHQTAGEAKLFAANLGITTPPTLAAILGDKLGVLFASDEDAAAYDRAEASRQPA